MSIFSVFSMEEYDAVGGDLRVKLLGWLSLRAGYHHHFYSYLDSDGSGGATGEMETGHRADGGVTARCVEKPDALVDLGYTWQTEGGLGVHQVRLGLLVPLFVEGLGANAHAYLDVFDEAWNSPYDEGEAAGSSGDASRLGILGDIGLSYRTEDLEVGGSFGAGATPYARQELRGMVKLAYQFDTGFAERREP